MPGLTTDQVDHHSNNGYVISREPLFDPGTFARLRAIFEEHLGQRGDLRGDELQSPHYEDPRLLEFLLANAVLDVVESLIGPDITLRASHFISKDPWEGRATPWHQDVDYFRRSDMLSSYDGITTVWLALSESDRDNGCMRVIAGSHRQGFTDHLAVDVDENTFDTGIPDIDESDTVDLELAPGEFSVHDGWVTHGARSNTSNRRRSGFVMGYMPATIVPDRTKTEGWRFWLARGNPHPAVRYEKRVSG